MYALTSGLMDVSEFYGTPTTCQLQGFGFQLGIVGTMAMDLALSLCYLLMVDLSWREEHLRDIERWLHLIM